MKSGPGRARSTLFEGPFHVKHVGKYKHLIHLCRYIHCNPVKDGFVASPGDWHYSNYLEWIGVRKDTLADQAFIRKNFRDGADYQDFVADYLKTRRIADEIGDYLISLEA